MHDAPYGFNVILDKIIELSQSSVENQKLLQSKISFLESELSHIKNKMQGDFQPGYDELIRNLIKELESQKTLLNSMQSCIEHMKKLLGTESVPHMDKQIQNIHTKLKILFWAIGTIVTAGIGAFARFLFGLF